MFRVEYGRQHVVLQPAVCLLYRPGICLPSAHVQGKLCWSDSLLREMAFARAALVDSSRLSWLRQRHLALWCLQAGTGKQATQSFDAVVVCNGHYTEPRSPHLPGSETFPGRQMHTHNYRDAASFHRQRVVVIGASASGEDIAREIGEVADQVRHCGWQHAWVTSDVMSFMYMLRPG